MNQETKEERKSAFIKATSFLREVHGISYQVQAERIAEHVQAMTYARLRHFRAENTPSYPTPYDMAALWDAFPDQLADVKIDGGELIVEQTSQEDPTKAQLSRLTEDVNELKQLLREVLRKKAEE